MTSMIFCPDAPVNIGEDRLILEVYCPKDTAAYLDSFLSAEANSEKWRL
jgi:hypothetical protein